MLQGRGYRHDLLDKGDVQMFREGEAAGTGDAGAHLNGAQRLFRFFQKTGKSLLDIGIMPFVIGKEQRAAFVPYRNFYSRGTDIDPKVFHHNKTHSLKIYRYNNQLILTQRPCKFNEGVAS